MSSICAIFLWKGCFISHAVILDHYSLVLPIQLDSEIPTITLYDREILTHIKHAWSKSKVYI